MIVTLADQAGQVRTAKVGFSWTVLFFGFLVPIYRGDAKWTVIMFIASILTIWLANIVLSFTYNGTYIRNLLSRGFRPADDVSREILIRNGFITD